MILQISRILSLRRWTTRQLIPCKRSCFLFLVILRDKKREERGIDARSCVRAVCTVRACVCFRFSPLCVFCPSFVPLLCVFCASFMLSFCSRVCFSFFVRTRAQGFFVGGFFIGSMQIRSDQIMTKTGQIVRYLYKYDT